MKYRNLGRSGLKVSTLCLGTMNFGPFTSEDEAFLILNEAVSAGINFVDTANQYGGTKGVGATETILGNWLNEDKARRDTIVLATKCHEPMSNDINDRGLSARHMVQACDDSLRRLKVENIDLYQMHHIDRSTPPEEIWQALEHLMQQGKITYVGSSNFPGWKIAQMNEKAIARHQLGLISEQSLYNLMERRVELEVLPACDAYGVGLIAWSPLSGGLLAGTSEHGPQRRFTSKAKARTDKHEGQLNAFQTLCRELDQPSSVVALAWLLQQKGVTSAIIGPRTHAQLVSALGATALELSADVVAQIDIIFPACGPAPEAYAW